MKIKVSERFGDVNAKTYMFNHNGTFRLQCDIEWPHAISIEQRFVTFFLGGGYNWYVLSEGSPHGEFIPRDTGFGEVLYQISDKLFNIKMVTVYDSQSS